ncbi:kinase-like protein [Punctularia strigosozonata HHB-11173 SS5]|uniref:non-specific serine/threonine protein kinase n=1 Tax=Punctularia strigosozonata (strain HHB-11173) TaxID=741275 RepID=R7S1X8_PUNST|nr:kinase-like protein [Punctularia strigosozonata HHB-11173 SS5]EIN04415.1 kinase-like protein [Punctularia strigosozonata HHB-11173 SS5]
MSLTDELFTRRASLACELRDRNWAFLQSYTKSQSHILLDKSSDKWYLCSLPLGHSHVKDKPEKQAVAIVRIRKGDENNAIEGGDISTQLEIEPVDDEARIFLNGSLAEVGDCYTLVPNTIVRINDKEYIYRLLSDTEDVPYHAERYEINQSRNLGWPAKPVYSATRIRTGDAVVVKSWNVSLPKLSKAADLLRTIEKLKHRNIASVDDWFMLFEDVGESFRRICGASINFLSTSNSTDDFTKGMVTSLAPGGNLYDYIKFGRKLGEMHARPVVAQLMDGLMYMHDQGIIHRNIEPKNILVCDESWGYVPTIKIGGLCSIQRSSIADVRVHEEQMVGDAKCAPPEILDHKYTELGDVFSTGALMFFILWGKSLYRVQKGKSLQEQMQTRRCNYVKERELMMSEDASDLLNGLIKKDMTDRLALHEARRHSWLYQRRVPPPSPDSYSVDDFRVVEFLEGKTPRPPVRSSILRTVPLKRDPIGDSDTESESDADAESDTDSDMQSDDGSETSSASASDASSDAVSDARSDADSESSSTLEEDEERTELEWYTHHRSDPLLLPDTSVVLDQDLLPSSPATTVCAIPVSDRSVGVLCSGKFGSDSDGGDDDTDTVVGYDDRLHPMRLSTEEEEEDAQVAPRTSRASRSKCGRGGRVGGSRRAEIAASSDGRQRARTSARIQAAKVRATELKRTEQAEARNVQKMMQSTEKKLARAAASAKSLLKNLAKLDAM